jgi:hypothetical protein
MNLVFETLHQERAAMRAVNHKLYKLGQSYHVGLPLHTVTNWLIEEGFTGISDGIYCGADGSTHEQVGPHTWLLFSWHKMESGRYEVVAYLS